MAMLNLMWQSLFGNNQNRKMFFRVHILFIEEGSAVYKWSDQRRQEVIKFITETCQKYQFTYTILPLEAIYDVSNDVDLKYEGKEA